MLKLKMMALICAVLVLNGCTIPEVYEAHGLRGVFTDNGKGDAFISGQTCEYGRNGQMVSYECAYGNYHIAEELGDIRAKPALNALIKKMSSDQLAYTEKSVKEGDESLIARHQSWSDMYKVPKQYDIHYLNKQSDQ